MNDFSKNVYLAVQKIPRGKVTNYGCIAFMAGKPRAARGVGFVLHRNPDPVRTPCHRVVFKDGSLCAGYVFGGPDVQRRLLEEEGVAFLPDGRVDMEQCGWFGGVTPWDGNKKALCSGDAPEHSGFVTRTF